jgi:predicted Ser/Thr protein kinase
MSEPIAWMASNELLFSVVKDEIYHIPLYTHPMRELTDEEINEVFKSIYGHNNSYINSSLFKFARAILQKASEK